MKADRSVDMLKQYARLTDPYDGTADEFNEELNIITGLVNLDLLWDKIEKRQPVDGNPRTVIDWNKTNTDTSRDT